MTWKVHHAAAMEALMALPDDDWSPADWACFESIRAQVGPELAQHQRKTAAKPSVKPAPRPVVVNRKKRAARERADKRAEATAGETWERNRTLALARSGGFCGASLPGCTIYAVHVHHKAGRVGPGANELGMLLAVCERCHADIHAHPERSYQLGHMVSRLGTVRP